MEEELTSRAPAKRGGRKLARRIAKLTDTALDSLEEILTDGAVKPADRLNAVKLAFEIAKAKQQDAAPDDGVIRVVLEGVPEEWAE